MYDKSSRHRTEYAAFPTLFDHGNLFSWKTSEEHTWEALYPLHGPLLGFFVFFFPLTNIQWAYIRGEVLW